MAGHIADAARQDWCTPKWLLDLVEESFGGPGSIDLDPCSNELAIVPAKTRYILPKNDGLRDPWFGNVFVNPPFGSGEAACKQPGCKKKKCWSCEFKQEVIIALDGSHSLGAKDFVDEKCRKKKCNHRGAHITENVPGLMNWTTRMAPANGAGHKACIGLLPAAVDTKHWQKIIFETADAICYLRGRVKFIGATAGAPMAIALVYWGPQPELFCKAFSKRGRAQNLRTLRIVDEKNQKVTIVVNGQPIEVYPMHWLWCPTLSDLIYRATDMANYGLPDGWEARTAKGDLITDWSAPWSTYMSNGSSLFVAPRPGVGG